jgi:hypothetical protein
MLYSPAGDVVNTPPPKKKHQEGILGGGVIVSTIFLASFITHVFNTYDNERHNSSAKPQTTVSVTGLGCRVVLEIAPQLSPRGRVDPVPDPLLLKKSGSAWNRTRDIWICSQEL